MKFVMYGCACKETFRGHKARILQTKESIEKQFLKDLKAIFVLNVSNKNNCPFALSLPMNGKFIEFHIEFLLKFVFVLSSLDNSSKLAFLNFLNSFLLAFFYASPFIRKGMNCVDS